MSDSEFRDQSHATGQPQDAVPASFRYVPESIDARDDVALDRIRQRVAWNMKRKSIREMEVKVVSAFSAFDQNSYEMGIMRQAAQLICAISFEFEKSSSLASWIFGSPPIGLPEVRAGTTQNWLDDWFTLTDKKGLFERSLRFNPLLEARNSDLLFRGPCLLAPVMRKIHETAKNSALPTVAFIALDGLPCDEDEIADMILMTSGEPIIWIFIGVEWENDKYGYYGILEDLIDTKRGRELNACLFKSSGSVPQRRLARRIVTAISRRSALLMPGH
ncbi:VWA domain-containing protein [Streptomyces sp. NPDC052236]|uniref:VWA domain-containing protein n=1 Tax=Streptomyces sp. NPDC052236 TaxID=3365686 RepID=UPI0037D41E34